MVQSDGAERTTRLSSGNIPNYAIAEGARFLSPVASSAARCRGSVRIPAWHATRRRLESTALGPRSPNSHLPRGSVEC